MLYKRLLALKSLITNTHKYLERKENIINNSLLEKTCIQLLTSTVCQDFRQVFSHIFDWKKEKN